MLVPHYFSTCSIIFILPQRTSISPFDTDTCRTVLYCLRPPTSQCHRLWHSTARNKRKAYGMSRIKPNVGCKVMIGMGIILCPAIGGYRSILECRSRASIKLTFILLTFIASHQGRIDRRSCKCTSIAIFLSLLSYLPYAATSIVYTYIHVDSTTQDSTNSVRGFPSSNWR